MGKERSTKYRILRWCILSFTGVVLLAVLFVTIELPNQKPRFVVKVDYYTNAASGELSAHLSVANESANTLLLHFCDAQEKEEHDWATNIVVNSTAGKVIFGHSVEQVDVALPAGVGKWRVPYYWGYQPTGLRKLKATMDYNIEINKVRRSLGRSMRFINNFATTTELGYTSEFAFSEELLEPDASPEPPPRASSLEGHD